MTGTDNVVPDVMVGSMHRLKSGRKFIYYTKIDEVRESFSTHDVVVSRSFFKALEKYPPKDTHFRYISIIEDQQAVAFLYFQIKKINLLDSLSGSFNDTGKASSWNKFNNSVKRMITGKVNFYTLVCGNMMQTGRCGMVNAQDFSRSIALEEIDEVVETLMPTFKKEGIPPVGILMKDFTEEQRYDEDRAWKLGYKQFKVQPSMHLKLREEWSSFEDYLLDLKSKYKVRTRRAIKKCADIEKRKLSLEEIELYKDEMHDMYKSIALQASFNLFILPEDYWKGLFQNMKDNFQMIGYFLDGKMVAFYTIIDNYETLDAHFLGYNKEINKSHHLYHNILLDLLQEAIRLKKKDLHLSRTAMAIKSSIGAKPEDLYLYLKLFHPIAKKMMPKILTYLTPVEQWEERNPFKG